MSLPDALRFTGLQVTSMITGVMAVVLGCVHFWPLLFIMGISLILAITARRYAVPAHILAVFGWMFYGSALLIDAVFSGPPTPEEQVAFGAIAVGVAGIHFGLMQAHQDQGDGPIRRKCKR